MNPSITDILYRAWGWRYSFVRFAFATRRLYVPTHKMANGYWVRSRLCDYLD
jgi:hypothetical protein